jgi:hypothetical protein
VKVSAFFINIINIYLIAHISFTLYRAFHNALRDYKHL